MTLSVENMLLIMLICGILELEEFKKKKINSDSLVYLLVGLFYWGISAPSICHDCTIGVNILKTQQRFLVFGTCFDVSNIIISHNEYIRFTE